MWFSKERKEKKDNEKRLLRINGREVKYVTTRDNITYGEKIVGRYGIINIENDELTIICEDKIVFKHSIEGLLGSELMSLDGIILSYTDEKTGEYVEVIVYYKYHRK